MTDTQARVAVIFLREMPGRGQASPLPYDEAASEARVW